MNNLHRVFLAINLPDNLRQKLADFSEQCSDLPAKWTKPDNLHITLNFLGNANDQEVCDICEVAAKVALRHEPFEINLNRIVYGPLAKIPSAREGEIRQWRPRMVWAMGEKSQEIGNLQKDLESSFFEFSGALYRKNDKDYAFSPHITLARIIQGGLRFMEPQDLPGIDEKIKHVFLVESIEVMESELRRGGPVYTVLESVKLGIS